MPDTFDLVVMGGGTAGYTAAIRAVQLGLSAVIIEQDRIGGVCLHHGCIPTKALLESAEALHQARTSETFGIISSGEPSLDYTRALARKTQIVEQLHTNLRAVIRKKGIEIIAGRGVFTSSTGIAVKLADGGSRTVSTSRTLVATGSRPRELAGLPAGGQRVLTSDHLLELATAPESIAIIGGGAVGLEFASFFLDLGCPVTVIEALDRLLPAEDASLGEGLARLLADRGATIYTGASLLAAASAVSADGVTLALECGGQRVQVDCSHVLVAIGRQGNVEGIGLEQTAARVEGGFVRVGADLRTDDANVYAAGDVTGHLLLAHAAAAEGFLAAQAIAGRETAALDYRSVPRVVYTRPQAAAVGLPEAEAQERGYAVKTRRFSFRNNSMAHIHGETDGFVKLVFEAESGRLLGAHVLGPDAVELISEAGLAISQGLPIGALADNIHPHPSLSETLNEAARLSAGLSIYW